MAQRRREDLNALAQVYAAQRLLGYLDGQYQERRPPDLAGRIGEDLARLAIECAAELVLIPLGLEHADHRLASDAGRRMVGRVTAPVIAYMDLPYGLGDPAIVAARLEELDNPAPWQPGPSNHAATREGKLRAVSCYASQIAPLQRSTSVEGQWERTFEPQSEMFWILSPRAHG
jgi:LmbE family N-acetylglucosaminyl deacetylase